MRLHSIFLMVAFPLASLAAAAQTRGPSVSLLDIGANYEWTHSNAPSGQCGCFSQNGGSGTILLNSAHSLSFVADLSGAHASNVNNTTQNISTYTYLFGGRYTLRPGSRWGFFGQVLAGLRHETSNYDFVQDRNAFAFAAGGGAALLLGRHLGWNVIQADWIHSNLPNGGNDRQNELRLGTGFYLRFRSR